jgi:hypothetical protein
MPARGPFSGESHSHGDRVSDEWPLVPASADWAEGVAAVRLTRFTGSVIITFDWPRRLKLAPEEWADTYLSKATCRNLLIDLLENKDQPKVLRLPTVSYHLQAEPR